jgi:hypothetical protein
VSGAPPEAKSRIGCPRRVTPTLPSLARLCALQGFILECRGVRIGFAHAPLAWVAEATRRGTSNTRRRDLREKSRAPLLSFHSSSECDRINLRCSSRHSAPLQGLAPYSACRIGKRPLPGFPVPGSRCASRVSHPLDASFLPKPLRLCFTPVTLLGFTLRRIPLPRLGLGLSAGPARLALAHCGAATLE